MSFVSDLLERSYKTFLQAFRATFSVAFAAPAAVIRPTCYQDSGGDLTTAGIVATQTGGWAVWIGV